MQWGGVKFMRLEKYNFHWGKGENNDYEFNHYIKV